MPDQEVADAPVEEEVIDDQPVDDGLVDEGGVDAAGAWDDIVPELAGQYADLTPAEREGHLMDRAAALAAGIAATADSAEEVDTATETAEVPPQPSPAEPPVLDVEHYHERILDGFGDKGMAGPVIDALDEMALYVQNMAVATLGIVEDQGPRLKKVESSVSDLHLPGKFNAALAQVAGATPADFNLAKEILKSGDAGNVKAAVELAVSRRPKTKAKPVGDAANRRGRAIAAQRIASGGRGPGPKDTSQTQRLGEWQNEYRAESAANKPK